MFPCAIEIHRSFFSWYSHCSVSVISSSKKKRKKTVQKALPFLRSFADLQLFFQSVGHLIFSLIVVQIVKQTSGVLLNTVVICYSQSKLMGLWLIGFTHYHESTNPMESDQYAFQASFWTLLWYKDKDKMGIYHQSNAGTWVDLKGALWLHWWRFFGTVKWQREQWR